MSQKQSSLDKDLHTKEITNFNQKGWTPNNHQEDRIVVQNFLKKNREINCTICRSSKG